MGWYLVDSESLEVDLCSPAEDQNPETGASWPLLLLYAAGLESAVSQGTLVPLLGKGIYTHSVGDRGVQPLLIKSGIVFYYFSAVR